MITRERIVANFRTVPLGEVVEFLDYARRPVKEEDRDPGPYPYYGANGPQGTIGQYLFDEPLVLLAEDGGHFDNPSRGIAYQVSGKCWVNNHAHVLRPKSTIDIRFLTRVLENYDVTPFVTGTTRGKLTQAGAAQVPVPIQPLNEQRRIAAILDQADALRCKRRLAATMLKKIPYALIESMFAANASKVRLGEICERITDGVHQKPHYTETGVPFLSVKNVREGSIDLSDLKFIDEVQHNNFTRRCKPEPGDILYTKVGSYGRAAKLPDGLECSIYVSLALLKPKRNRIDPYYFEQCMNSPLVKRQADRRIKGIGVPDLHLDQIEQFEIPLPTMHEQQTFAAKATEVARLISIQDRAAEELDRLFAVLQYEAFAGDISTLKLGAVAASARSVAAAE